MKVHTFHSRTPAATVMAVTVFALTTAAANAQAEVTVNGSAVDLSPAPIISAGRVFVPLRGVFEQLGASVVYSNGTINATGNGRDISLQIGSTQATVNGQPQIIDVAPFIVGSSTYVPLRFISEALGDSVSWDDANSIAAIDTGGGPATYFTPGTASYVDTPPPPIPSYAQPYVPVPNFLWQPGYWAWGAYGYYWVPGTWVEAPQPGYLWTPGYWQWNDGGYSWNPGYWALAIGFYGGINYGGGYFGDGYDGGRWSNNVFRYNTYVTRVNTTIVHNVYVDRYIYVNESTTRTSYNGGRRGLQARPTAQQLAVTKQRHLGMTTAQQQHVRQAEQDRRLLATVNQNRPPVLAVTRPLSPLNRPAGILPVEPSDRVNPQANVAPVHVPVTRAVRPTARIPVVHAQAAAAAAPVHAARAPHVPFAHPAAPVFVAPVHAAQPAPVPPVHGVRPAYAPGEDELPARGVAPGRGAAPHVPAVYAAPPGRMRVIAPLQVRAMPQPQAAPVHAPAAHENPKNEKPPR